MLWYSLKEKTWNVKDNKLQTTCLEVSQCDPSQEKNKSP